MAGQMQDEILAKAQLQIKAGKRDFEMLAYGGYVGSLENLRLARKTVDEIKVANNVIQFIGLNTANKVPANIKML